MSLKKRKRADAVNAPDEEINDLKAALLLEKRENLLLKAEVQRANSLCQAGGVKASGSNAEDLAVFSEDSAKKCAERDAQKRGFEDVSVSDAVAARRIRLEMDRLRMFVLKWQAAFSGGDVQRNYEKSLALVTALKTITEKNDGDDYDLNRLADKMHAAEKIISAPYAALSETAATEDCFDLNEVINPSEKLDLEKLCKELGVME